MKNTSSPSENLLIEEREEVMVSKKGCSLSKTQFLKPFVTSIDGCSVAELPRRQQEQRLSVSSPRISFSGVRFAQPLFVSWLEKLEALHAPTWRKAGIFEAIKASKYNIEVNPSMILPIVEKWCPETKSFVFPWGEATITLEDVMVLLEFSVLGSSVNAPLESSEMVDSVKEMEKARVENRSKDQSVRQGSWIRSFFGRGGHLEHEAFLALWLSHFVFPVKSGSIPVNNLPIAVRLARGERIALAPAVLASLYKDLGEISRGKSTKRGKLPSLFKLVKVWVWERFKNLRPEAKEIPKGEPRISRWEGVRQKAENVRLSFDDFEWRPYTIPLKNWNPLRFYLEEAMWVTVDDKLEDEFVSFARCVRSSKLVGIGFVEDYYPNRVAMQFGLGQDLPGLVAHQSNFTRNEAWDDYNKCLDGLKLFIPSRLSTTSITARYRDWWLKSVSEFMGSEEMQKESTETFNARNTFDHHKKYDGHTDVSLKALPLIPVVQKLQEGFTVKRRRSRMRRLAKIYKIGELVNSVVSSGWKMDKTSGDVTNKRSSYESLHMKTACGNGDESSMNEEDVNMTISQIIRCGKKYSDADKPGGDATESLGKRSRRYLVADSYDDLGPCQKNALKKLEQRSEEDDETGKQPEMTRQRCDDVNGSNAEKKTMIDDITKEAECWLHKDREKQRCIEKLCSEVKMEKDIDERLRQRKLAIKELGVKLEARIIKVEKSLAKIRKWKTRPKMQFLPS
ncbi:PREDICTED: uncharacterized protein LOC104758385 [Camelina sativa]|uniref:Uncharacterized protein LOC104758385 n=1 Tax=Camelina sativa TaxID=90675 RepID=A0ABM0X2A9_CAMSA|nr:PREDICTED: uncharacterized protein LOC104758385 [Camelina sativa]